MKKQEFIKMGYKEIESGEVETVFKKFENGNMYIIQFNHKVQENEIGRVYLTEDQFKILIQ